MRASRIAKSFAVARWTIAHFVKERFRIRNSGSGFAISAPDRLASGLHAQGNRVEFFSDLAYDARLAAELRSFSRKPSSHPAYFSSSGIDIPIHPSVNRAKFSASSRIVARFLGIDVLPVAKTILCNSHVWYPVALIFHRPVRAVGLQEPLWPEPIAEIGDERASPLHSPLARRVDQKAGPTMLVLHRVDVVTHGRFQALNPPVALLHVPAPQQLSRAP